MTDQHSSLSLAALKEIVASMDRSIAVFDRAGPLLSPTEKQVRAMLVQLRQQLAGQIARHPGNRPGS